MKDYKISINIMENRKRLPMLEQLNEAEKITYGKEDVWDLMDDPPEHFVKQFLKDKDVLFTNDNKAYVTDRTSNLTWYGDTTKLPKNIDQVKYIYAGYESEFYEVEDFFKMLQAIYKGNSRKMNPIIPY